MLIALAGAEMLLRVSSRYFLHIFDIEMWRYAREIKLESPLPGLVEDHRQNAEAELMGVRIRTDASGFRRANSVQESARTPNKRLVIALGDSLTLGWGVPEGETYSDVLEKILNERAHQTPVKQFTVLNAGIGNSNTSMELARYERNLRPLHPDWLIVGFFINDAEVDPVPVQNPIIYNSALAALLTGQLRMHLGSTYENYETYYRRLYTDINPGWARLQAALATLAQDLRQDQVRATLLLLPEMHEPKNFGPFKDIYGQVAELGRAAGFEVIDASQDFRPGPGNRFWVSRNDAHPNAAAQAIFAAALAKSTFISLQ